MKQFIERPSLDRKDIPVNKFRGRSAIFVTYSAHISGRPGGVQTCSQEYLALLKATGFTIEIIQVEPDRRLPVRVRRRLSRSPYVGVMRPCDIDRVITASRDAEFVFLNQVNLSGTLYDHRFNKEITKKTILLSHGAEVTDLLNQVRSENHFGLMQTRFSMKDVNRVLNDEVNSRRGVIGAVCLSPFDADFERWIGVKHTIWLPRTIVPDLLDWKPIQGRFGYLGTLNHTPNLGGLIEVLNILEGHSAHEITIRIVGGPENFGRWLHDRYKSVQYLGPLTDEDLKREASTWSAFLNPVFCQARGCSTKLATAIAWGIPILTTSVGARGYMQASGLLNAVEDSKSYLRLMINMLDPVQRELSRRETLEISKASPSILDNADKLIKFLTTVLDSNQAVN